MSQRQPRLQGLILIWIAWSLGVHEARSFGEWHQAIGEWSRHLVLGTPGPAVAVWGLRLWTLALLLGIQAAGLGSGIALARVVVSGRRQPLLLCLPLGWGMAALVTLGLALTGLAIRPVLGFAALAPGVLGLRLLREAWRHHRRSAVLPPPTIGAVVAILVLAVTTVAALAPEVGVDPLVYHQGRVHRLLLLHRYAPWPYNLLDSLPILWEMYLAPLTSLGREEAARWVNPFLFGYSGILVYQLARRMQPAIWAWGAAALFLSNPFLVQSCLSAKNDFFVGALGLAGLGWALDRRRRGNSGRGVVAGFLCGCAFATKYTAGSSLLAIAAARWIDHRRRMTGAAALATGFAAAAGPHMLATFILMGDPVYPVSATFWSSPFFSRIAGQRLVEGLFAPTAQDPSAVTRWRNVVLAWNITGSEESLLRWTVFLPGLLLVRTWPRILRMTGAAAFTIVLMWMAGPPQIRYASMAFGLCAVLVASVFAGFRTTRHPRMGYGLLGAVLSLQALHAFGSTQVATAFAAGAGLEDAAAYRARRLTSYQEAVEAVGRSVSAGSHLLLHGESRVALFPVLADNATFSTVAFPPYRLIHASRTPEDVWKRVRQEGWTHLLYNRLTAFFWKRSMADDPWSPRELRLWGAFWRRHATLTWESPTIDMDTGYYYLFRMVPLTRVPPAAVMPGIEGWVYAMEEDRKAGRTGAALGRLRVLREAAGGTGAVDLIEATLFRDRLTPDDVARLRRRAYARGFHSPSLDDTLAREALRQGQPAAALRFWQEAAALDPNGPWTARAAAALGARSGGRP